MAVSFPASTKFQQWMRGLRVPWMGPKAQTIMGAFAKVAGDLVYDWTLRAQLEHLPEYASPQAVGYIASERQLDTGSLETSDQLATRTTQAAVLWKYAGTALGVLMAMHYAGFDGAIIVQQNGLAFQLTKPLPPFGPLAPGQAWDPKPSLTVSSTPSLAWTLTSNVAPYRTIPAGTPWFSLSLNTDLCSRFAVIYPSWPFSALATASFFNSDTATVTLPFAMANTNYMVMAGLPSAPVELSVDNASKTTTGFNLQASGPWSGTVYVIAWGAGINPFNTFSSVSADVLRSIIAKWKPAKTTCVSVNSIQTGSRTWDYFPPGTTWDGGTYPTWDTNTVSQILGAF